MTRRGMGGTLASGSVLAITVAFLIYARIETTNGAGAASTRYRAVFSSSDGLAPGSPVTIGGVVVGRVASIRLDTVSMAADVAFDLRRDIPLETGARLAVVSSGFGASGALAVTQGQGGRPIPPGQAITDTTPSRSLEAAVGDYIFGSGLSSAR